MIGGQPWILLIGNDSSLSILKTMEEEKVIKVKDILDKKRV